MSGDVHVRFCERLEGKFLRATRLALFHARRDVLYAWKQAIIAQLQALRLTVHENAAQLVPTHCGAPWLGFVIFPGYRRVKGRKVRHSRHHLWKRYHDYRAGRISFAEFDASVQGWINHVSYADSWGLRDSVFSAMPLLPGNCHRASCQVDEKQ